MPNILIYDRERSALGFITGSDAGYWTIDPVTGKRTWHPGWEVEKLTDLVAAINILEVASRFKERGLAEKFAGPVAAFVQDHIANLPMGSRVGA